MACRVELPPPELQRTQSEWPGSRYQKFVHNRILDEIDRTKVILENSEDFPAFQKAQAQLRALRQVLGVIHEGDTDTTKKFYGII